MPGQDFQRLDPLRKDDGLATAFGHLGEVGLKLLQLGTVARGRVEVADLLEPHDQLEDMLNRDRLAQGVELDDAVLLGPFVAEALGGGQFEVDVVDHLGRHVGGDFFLDAAKNAIAGQFAAASAAAFPAECAPDRQTRRC